MPEAAGLLVLSHLHRQDQEGKLDIVQDRAGKGSQHALPPPGFAVGADDDQGGAVFLGHAIQGAPRQTDGGLDDHLEALFFQDPPLGRQAGGRRGRQTLAGAAEEIRGDHVGQDDARNTPADGVRPRKPQSGPKPETGRWPSPPGQIWAASCLALPSLPVAHPGAPSYRLSYP